MAQPRAVVMPLALSTWKNALSWTGAVLISLAFLAAGVWKITDPTSAAVRMTQALVPQNLSLAAALVFGIAETFAGVMILVPRFRRWGAWLAGALLVAFLGYFAVNYTALRGAECTCFPWVKRAVGPAFFVGDGIMLALAAMAGLWARPSENRRSAALILAAVSVFAGVSFGVAATRNTGVKAPETLTVDGRPFSTETGRIFIYYFDPECMHCVDAAKRMAKLDWTGTKLIGVATQQPQFAQEFLRSTGLQAGMSTDLAALREKFPFVAPPAGTAIENGRQVALLTQFENAEPAATLRKLGFVK
jgi:uncharacterized membrane protein YphA (DoxX/SURF4 family)